MITGLLIFQATYVLAGIIFNAVSLWRKHAGKPCLTMTNPLLGLRSMGIAALITMSYFIVPGWVYGVAWAWFVIRLVLRAVIPHFRAILCGKNIENYSSVSAAIIAFLINAMGTVGGVLGSIVGLSQMSLNQ